MNTHIKRFCDELEYTFQNESYLRQALTHRSAGNSNNERLEFLGDSILNFIISDVLFSQFPKESEGLLSRLRSHLVKGDMLAQIAMELDLGDCLYLGQGELKSGGFRRASILADALEAVFAAIFLDGGLEQCKRVILKIYHSRLYGGTLQNNLKDPKTRLQEKLQAQKYPLPVYKLIKITGEEHDQIFHVSCSIKSLNLKSQGHGENRRKAEQDAAKQLLKKM